MFAKDLTEETLWRLSVIERTASALSLVGILFIISTFLLSRAFHKSINRLIFYASVGNLFTCVGTLVSRSAIKGTGITNPHLCKTQAFLIQMFMPADALWAFVMALNVYLTFYWRYRAAQLKSLEKWYILFCYGVTFLLAFVLLWVTTKKRGSMYGNATLWCWISGDWDHYRMYLFYGPVWFICVCTILIYIRLFVTLVSNWRSISGFSRSSGPILPLYNEPITGIRTTDISFKSEPAAHQPEVPLEDMPNRFLNQYPRPAASTGRAYNCQITGGNSGPSGPLSVYSPTSPYHGTIFPTDPKEKFTVNANPVPTAPHVQPILSQRHNSNNADNALKVMGAVALFFFFIMLITWIPSSANRLYTVVHPKQVSLVLEYAAACVLPMQGFWNCVIYMIVSHEAVGELWKNLKERRQWTAQNIGSTIRDAFADSDTVQRRLNSSRNSTVIGSSSRPSRVFHNDDDSITLLESVDPSRSNSSRPHTGRAGFDRI
ncbi:hypothetical protein BKA65DRAFT_183996 [Rhexocercosporidium sp. MPI-PUGE-AT-0058]|nr:hypothetical protein BKA65DRAFT_183996 [Rhexocercosporidium sp. MPI-PUGE-AT-0058]